MGDQDIEFVGDAKSSTQPETRQDKPATEIVEDMAVVALTEEDVR